MIEDSPALPQIPSPPRLQELMRALALLDSLVLPDWEDRTFSYDPAWDDGAAMASMRDGCGDWFAIRFPSAGGAVVRGFAHESAMSPWRNNTETLWPQLFDGLPPRYSWAREADGFVAEEVTFCLWFDNRWTRGPVVFPSDVHDPDGSQRLLALLRDDPQTWLDLAQDVYERTFDRQAVAAVYASTPLDAALAARFDPDMPFYNAESLAKELEYPIAR